MSQKQHPTAKQFSSWRNSLRRQKHIDSGLTDSDVEKNYVSAILKFANWYVPNGVDMRKLCCDINPRLEQYRADINEWLSWEHAYSRRGYRTVELRDDLTNSAKNSQMVYSQLSQTRLPDELPKFHARDVMKNLESDLLFWDLYYL